MGSARNVGKGFLPLDEKLELLPRSLSPHGHESLVRLACWMLFEDLLGIQVSKSLSERYIEEAGAAYVGLQTAEVERLE